MFLGLKRSVTVKTCSNNLLLVLYLTFAQGFCSICIGVLFGGFLVCLLIDCSGLQEDDILREQIRIHGTEK